MEAFGIVTGAAQLFTTISGILTVVIEIRDALKHAPKRIKDRAEHLDALISVLRLLRGSLSQQHGEIHYFLDPISAKTKLVQDLLHKALKAVNKKLLHRVCGTLVFIRDESAICDTLTAIEQDKANLLLYLQATSCEVLHKLANQSDMSSPSPTSFPEGSNRASQTLTPPATPVPQSLSNPPITVNTAPVCFPLFPIDSAQGPTRSPSQGVNPLPPQQPADHALDDLPNRTAHGPSEHSQTNQNELELYAKAVEIMNLRGHGGHVSIGSITVGTGSKVRRGNVEYVDSVPPPRHTFVGDVQLDDNAIYEDMNMKNIGRVYSSAAGNDRHQLELSGPPGSLGTLNPNPNLDVTRENRNQNQSGRG